MTYTRSVFHQSYLLPLSNYPHLLYLLVSVKRILKIIIIVTVPTLAISLAAVFCIVTSRKLSDGPDKSDGSGGIPSCEDRQVLFTRSPVNLDEITSITPLGNLNPPGHTFPVKHMYFNLKDIRTSADADEPTPDRILYAPGEIWITQISSTEYLDKNESDYSIDFSPCDEFHAYFIHVTSLSEKLDEVFTQSKDDCWEEDLGGERMRNCDKDVHISMQAGEEIGTVGGNKYNFDLGTSDMRVEPSEFARGDKRFEGIGYVVCPLDYFSDDIKEVLYNKLGDSSGKDKRTIEPICGTPHQDLLGTAQGVWYLKGSSNYNSEEDHIALVHDNIDPRIPVFSLGNSLETFGIQTGTYRFDPTDSGLVDRDFDDVTADGNIYCYELNTGRDEDNFISILLQLENDETLKVGKGAATQCGKGPWEFGDYLTFEKLQ